MRGRTRRALALICPLPLRVVASRAIERRERDQAPRRTSGGQAHVVLRDAPPRSAQRSRPCYAAGPLVRSIRSITHSGSFDPRFRRHFFCSVQRIEWRNSAASSQPTSSSSSSASAPREPLRGRAQALRRNLDVVPRRPEGLGTFPPRRSRSGRSPRRSERPNSSGSAGTRRATQIELRALGRARELEAILRARRRACCRRRAACETLVLFASGLERRDLDDAVGRGGRSFSTLRSTVLHELRGCSSVTSWILFHGCFSDRVEGRFRGSS